MAIKNKDNVGYKLIIESISSDMNEFNSEENVGNNVFSYISINDNDSSKAYSMFAN
jgi:hypothetical protein